MPTDRAQSPDGRRGGDPPTTVAPSTRVTVAFPFSTIKMHEPDERLRLLAMIVADLADHVAEIDPGPDAQRLCERARACANALAS